MRKQLLKLLLLSFGLLSSGSAWADDTYERITSTSDLELGKNYIIVCENRNMAMGVVSSQTNAGIGYTVAITNNTVTLSSTSNVNVITLCSTSTGYTLYGNKDDQYIGWSSGTSLASGSSASADAYKWTIAFSGNNVAIVNKSATDRSIRAQLYYDRFSAYTDGIGADIQLYKKVATPKALSSIAITTAPTKISYTEDEVFDKMGMVVTATYNDASTADITSLCTFTPSLTTPLLPSNTSIEVSYTENAVTKTANQAITVAAKPRYTITWMVNGVANKSNDYKEGVSLTPEFPSLTTLYGKTFMGWVTTSTVASNYSGSFVNTTSATSIANTTYYAVFATLVSGNEVLKVDNLTKESIGVTSYKSWSNKQWTSSAKYAGYSTMGYDEKSIQMNATSPIGIVSTTSGGKLSKVEVEWTSDVSQSSRELQIYGKNTAYSSPADLYDTDSKKGTLLGAIVCGTSTELVIDGNYTYVGLCSSENSITLDKISVIWTNGTPDTYTNYCTTITAVPVTMGTAGYATFACTEALDLSTLPDGLTAYRAVVDGKTVTFKPISQAVPANTGLLLKGANNGNYEITIANSGAEVEGGNAFLVNTAGTTFSADNDYYYFGLKKDTFTFGTFDPATVAIPANKAYLKIAKSAFPAGARELSLVFEEESTGMDASLVNSEKRILNSEIYDLQGRRVVKPVKGLYIVNGKKVMVE